jgi:hypothetical protein
VLREELTRARTAGEVFVWSTPHAHGADAGAAVRDLLAAPPPPLIGTSHADFILEQGGQAVDGGLAHLKPIDTGMARRLLTNVIRFDLAYHAELTDAETASRLADRVVAELPEPARWWTNGTIGLPEGDSWTGLTDATFDTGVIGVSEDRLLVVWFMDED